MKLHTRTSLALVGAFIAYACSGDSDETSTGGSAVANLTKFSAIAAGDVCEAGGTMIETGSDDDGDGELSDSEVTSSVNVCNGSDATGQDGTNGNDGPMGENGTNGVDGTNGNDGSNGLDGDDGDDGAPGADAPVVLSSSAPADLTTCPAGGVVVSFGGDLDEDSVLDAGEIDASTTVCSGVGGGDACAPVMKVTPLSGPTPCEAGGVLVEYGPDSGAPAAGGAGGAGGAGSPAACDGLLDASEVAAAEVVCNGVDGEDGEDGDDGDPGQDGDDGDDGDPGQDGDDGADGTSMAVRLVYLAPGHATCADGGFLLESGVDDNGNGTLENGEVDDENYSCF